MMVIIVFGPIVGDEILNAIPQCGERVSHVLRSARDRVGNRVAYNYEDVNDSDDEWPMFGAVSTFFFHASGAGR